jgi:hypothetical protein
VGRGRGVGGISQTGKRTRAFDSAPRRRLAGLQNSNHVLMVTGKEINLGLGETPSANTAK